MDINGRCLHFYIAIIAALQIAGLPRQVDATGSTAAMLDAMENLMTGGTEFDPAFEQKLYTCMDQINPILRQAAVKRTSAWKSF